MSDDLLMKKLVISITFAELILQRLINWVQRNEARGLSLERCNTFPYNNCLFEISSFVFHSRKSYRFGTTWEWLNDDNLYFLSELSLWRTLCVALSCDWNVPHVAVTIVLTQIPCLKIILFSKQQKVWSFSLSFFPPSG